MSVLSSKRGLDALDSPGFRGENSLVSNEGNSSSSSSSKRAMYSCPTPSRRVAIGPNNHNFSSAPQAMISPAVEASSSNNLSISTSLDNGKRNHGHMMADIGFSRSNIKRTRRDDGGQQNASQAENYCPSHSSTFDNNVSFNVQDTQRLAEMNRLRTEYDHILAKKQRETDAIKQEAYNAQQQSHELQQMLERLSGENKLLKRAVAIQNQKNEAGQQELSTLKTLMQQACDHIKKLEQSNYALRIHLQSSGNVSGLSDQPRDIY